jgi:lipoprotein signal peptidase
LFWTLALLGLAADQATKYGVNAWLDKGNNQITVAGVQHPGFELIPRMLSLVRQQGLNQGALFGLGNDPEHGSKANLFFAAVSAIAAVAIVIWSLRSTVSGSWVLSLGLGLILAGALGNLYDRLVFGGVRDFIWVYYESAQEGLLKFNFPVFNVADSCLCVGAAILLLHTFFTPAGQAATDNAPAPSPVKVGGAPEQKT